MQNGVLILAEQLKGVVSDISYELLGAGRLIADSLHVPLGAVLLGPDLREGAGTLGVADNVFVIENSIPEVCSPMVNAALLQALIEDKGFKCLLLGGTNLSAGMVLCFRTGWGCALSIFAGI